MTALDPALCARLIAEARADDGRMTRVPWGPTTELHEAFEALRALMTDEEPTRAPLAPRETSK